MLEFVTESACNDDTATYEKCLWVLLFLKIISAIILYLKPIQSSQSAKLSQREHLNTARGSDGERKFLLLCYLISIIVILLIMMICATFMCTVYTLIELIQFKPEMIQLIQVIKREWSAANYECLP